LSLTQSVKGFNLSSHDADTEEEKVNTENPTTITTNHHHGITLHSTGIDGQSELHEGIFHEAFLLRLVVSNRTAPQPLRHKTRHSHFFSHSYAAFNKPSRHRWSTWFNIVVSGRSTLNRTPVTSWRGFDPAKPASTVKTDFHGLPPIHHLTGDHKRRSLFHG